MGKTYRRYSSYSEVKDFCSDKFKKKIRKIDRKHDSVTVADGSYINSTSQNFKENGKKVVHLDWWDDGHHESSAKKRDKRAKSKFLRNSAKKYIHEEEDCIDEEEGKYVACPNCGSNEVILNDKMFHDENGEYNMFSCRCGAAWKNYLSREKGVDN